VVDALQPFLKFGVFAFAAGDTTSMPIAAMANGITQRNRNRCVRMTLPLDSLMKNETPGCRGLRASWTQSDGFERVAVEAQEPASSSTTKVGDRHRDDPDESDAQHRSTLCNMAHPTLSGTAPHPPELEHHRAAGCNPTPSDGYVNSPPLAGKSCP